MNLHTHTNPVNWLPFYNGESWQPAMLCPRRAVGDCDPVPLDRACISSRSSPPHLPQLPSTPQPLEAHVAWPCGDLMCHLSASRPGVKGWGFLGREKQCQGKGLVKHRSRYLTQGRFYDLCQLALFLAPQKKDLTFWRPVTAAVCQVSGIRRPRQLRAVPTRVPTPSCWQGGAAADLLCSHMASSTQRDCRNLEHPFSAGSGIQPFSWGPKYPPHLLYPMIKALLCNGGPASQAITLCS